jgi:hypothetical protein
MDGKDPKNVPQLNAHAFDEPPRMMKHHAFDKLRAGNWVSPILPLTGRRLIGSLRSTSAATHPVVSH